MLDACLPFVSGILFALPPKYSPCCPCDVARSQWSVLRRMPFSCNIGVALKQRVSIDGLDATAEWAQPFASSIGAALHEVYPRVIRVRLALPPNTFVAARQHQIRRERTVFSRVPFTSNSRKAVGKRPSGKEAGATARTKRTSGFTSSSSPYGCFPNMVGTFWTNPPSFEVRPARDIIGRNSGVLCRMPFFYQPRSRLRYCLLASVVTGFRTNWARRICTNPEVNPCLPFMVRIVGTEPPHRLPCIHWYGSRCKLAVFGRMPLFC